MILRFKLHSVCSLQPAHSLAGVRFTNGKKTENSDWIKSHTLESGLNSRFLRILLKISVSSSCRLLSSVLDWLERLRRRLEPEAEVLGVAAAVAPAAPEGSWPGRGASAEGSSTCSMSHSIAWVTDMLQKERKLLMITTAELNKHSETTQNGRSLNTFLFLMMERSYRHILNGAKILKQLRLTGSVSELW